MFKKFIYFIVGVCLIGGNMTVNAQLLNPVRWSATCKMMDGNLAEVQITAQVDKEWHLYSQYSTQGLAQPTEFIFEKSGYYRLKGKTSEPKSQEVTDEFGTDRYFEMGTVIFRQKIEILTDKDFTIAFDVEAQACTGGKCVQVPFSFTLPVKGVPQTATPQDTLVKQQPEPSDNPDSLSSVSMKQTDSTDHAVAKANHDIAEQNEQDNTRSDTWWMVFLIAFGAGLLALITPCVFPMIPMTVSFFIKGEKTRRQGLTQATFFGASIIFIFTVLGLILTLALGEQAMYIISTHWIPNTIFFVIFMIFAFSFFGLFEITLPSSWINKSDKQADKGGYMAAFFIALTTVLVSFSCTGPILGAALMGLASGSGNSFVFLFSMLGFSLGFALPFTLIAAFPSVMSKLKSGSWLNTVKIVFGFLEIALGLKFISMADLSANWGLLDRETYLALWIVTFSLLGFYLLGKLRFKGDRPLESVSVPRLFLSLACFAFVVYMIPGLWGAPLKAISGYIPPMETQDFNVEHIIYQNSKQQTAATASPSGNDLPADRKYASQLHLPTGFEGFFDLEEAKAYAKRVNKPIFIDFTGKTCSNCREMEHYVWVDPKVKPVLQNEYVMVALYADVNTIKLPENEWVKSESGKIIKTLGAKNLNYQITRFSVNAQPYYVLMDAEGNLLTPQPRAYNRDVNAFAEFLEEGLRNFKNKSQ